MATTTKAVADILDRWDIGYYADSQENFLHLGVKSPNVGTRIILLGAIQNGLVVNINAPMIFKLNNKVFKAVFLEKLLELQNSLVLTNFYLNTHSNGEEWVGASIDLPLFEGELTYQSLFSCMTHLTNHLKEIVPRFRHILATGNELDSDR